MEGKNRKQEQNIRQRKTSEAKMRKGNYRRKKARWPRVLLFLGVLAAVLLGGMFLLTQIMYQRMTYAEVESVSKEAMKEDGVTNILLIGNDSRENGEEGRSDAMILLSISDRTRTIHLTSLLRDMYVEIPGHDGNRLNAAYAYGGAELLMETVEQNLGISVSQYMLVNFESFAALVDAVGGVDLELTAEEIELVNGYLVEYNMLTGRPEGTDYMDASSGGLVHLNGPQALAYSRNRYIGTDFARTQRQRQVLSGVMKNLPGALLKNPGEVIDSLLSNLTTNLTGVDFWHLTMQAGKLLTYDLVQGSIPVEGSYQNATIRGMAVLEVDFEKNRDYIRTEIYGK